MRKNKVSKKRILIHIFSSLLLILVGIVYWANNSWTIDAIRTLLQENSELFQRVYRLETLVEPPGTSYPPYEAWENKERET